MENSHRFFANKECKYYPCHKGLSEFNCLFCYCPMYFLDECLGHPVYKKKEDGRVIKVCTDCNFPHHPKNYDLILKKLSAQSRNKSQDVL